MGLWKFWRKGRISTRNGRTNQTPTVSHQILSETSARSIVQTPDKCNEFKHEPLSAGVAEIRLLEHISDYSSYRLHRFTVEDAPPYLALSYHWGDSTPHHPISINGQHLLITKNLNAALRSVYSAIDADGAPPLWNKGDSVFLWADAICIDQTNINEKNIQVPLMSQIYQRAEGAIGYLGNPTRGEDPHQPFLALARRAGAVVINDPHSFDNPFFTRAWITQEAVLSKEFICLYGNESNRSTFALALLGSFIHQAQTPGKGDPRFGISLQSWEAAAPSILQIYSRSQLRTSLKNEPSGINVVKVLSLTRPAKATDQRDKVYSVLGLLKQEDRQNIIVDYSANNTVPQVYTNLAKYLVTTPDCMRMLAHAGKSPNFPPMPTWVPDWSHESRYPLDYRHYRSAGETSADLRVSEDGKKLHVKAIILAEIKLASIPVTYPSAQIEDGPFDGLVANESLFFYLKETIYQYCRLCQAEFGRLPGHGNVARITSRTLTADRGMGDRRSTLDDQKFYDAFDAQYPHDENDPTSPTDQLAYFPFDIMAKQCNGGRRLCYTGTGQVGLIPDNALVGDYIALFPGAELLFVIRPFAPNEFELIGHCYLHECMDGEVLRDMDRFLQIQYPREGKSVDGQFEEIILV